MKQLELWPTQSGAVLLLSHLVLFWVVTQYLVLYSDPSKPLRTREAFPNKDDRSGYAAWKSGPWRFPPIGKRRNTVLLIVVGIIGTVVVAGPMWLGRRTLVLAIPLALLWAALPMLRQVFSDRYRLAEWEIASNAAFLFFAGTLLAAVQGDVREDWTLIKWPLSYLDVSAYMCVAAGSIFLSRGGTLIVRGFLEQAGTLPEYADDDRQAGFEIDADASFLPFQGLVKVRGVIIPSDRTSSAEQIEMTTGSPLPIEGAVLQDEAEVTRGRMIGNLERQIVLLLALSGSYPAVGFLMAAKGFVRAKEFEKRNYAEYFLIGTLASTAAALLVGASLRRVFAAVWMRP